MKYGILTSVLVMGLAACSGSGGIDSDEVTPLPTVTAGPDQTVTEGDLVELTGTLSSTSGSLDFVWAQVSGPSVTLRGSTTLTPQFNARDVDEESDLVFRLTVTNGAGAAADELTVTINDQTRINGPSARGIDDTMEARRVAALAARPAAAPIVEGREVRTFDGSLNNTANPEWGAGFIQFQRLVDLFYRDGVEAQIDIATRSNARFVSNEAMAQDDDTSIPTETGTSDYLWLWAQFIAHDIQLFDGAAESADILVPTDDPTFDPDGTAVASFLYNRSFFDPATSKAAVDDENLDENIPRQQMNEMTSWLDGSAIYGSTADRADALRDTANPALLATSTGSLLPVNTAGLTNAKGYESDGSTLFLAGDYRANEHPGLAALHILFVREHNRLAAAIELANPGLTDDEVFERARRLVVAKMQIITYEEFLPTLLGADAIPAWTAYDPAINPSAYNAAATAALQFSYSMQSEVIQRLDADGDVIAAGNLALRDTWYKAPSLITDDASLEALLRGYAAQAHQKSDLKIVDDLRNAYLAAPEEEGLDVAALILQRGRDHGLPAYNPMREDLELEPYINFSEITDDTEASDALAEAYGALNTVDAFAGGLAETPVEGSMMGELFHTLLVRQFTDLRDGDRFWWQNDLTAAEQAEVAGTRLSDIIRDNTGIDTELQDDVFAVPTP